MAILKLQPGKPERLSLRYLKPREVKGHAGIEFQYSLIGGDTIYLPPIAKSEIDSLSLAGSEPFTITKTIGQGNAVAFTVERIPQPKPIQRADSVVRENRTTEISVRPNLTTAQSQQLFKQLVATIEAVKAAEEFAVSIARPVNFTEADIRAMAISGFIESSRRAA